ncbi:MAG: aldose 1-epimerase [Alphaproteobacteria bacterium]|nr:aldose 1-epimerase [Alphaproteobacteria bacterium]MDE2110500.1 aldose 1-epimerase [Alphaproteobacteria bacterium]MDE2493250.1 aldose 1-epimerase [Alphaproteobacteria bacterium]
MITLARGDCEADLVPEIGGAVSRFTFAGQNVLRRAAKDAADVREMGSFPLVPYANRIERGLLHFQGRAYRIPRNFCDHPHPLHGQGWRTAWRVASLSRYQATLAFDHSQGDDWPWAYSAEQVFVLTETGLRVRLSVRNRDTQAMPATLGFHPYYPRWPRTRLTASVSGMWLADDTMIPTELVEAARFVDLGHGTHVSEAPFVDNSFTGWRGVARIDQPESGISVSLGGSVDCTVLHCFMPVGQSFFCAEPVSAMPNAFNRPEPAAETGARVLAPGDTFAIEMILGVRRL